MASDFQVGYTENILSFMLEKEKNNKKVGGNINVVTDKKIIGVGANADIKIQSRNATITPGFAVGADTETGVLVSQATTFEKTNQYKTETFSTKAGYNFGTESSVGKVMEVNISSGNKFGDKRELGVACYGDNVMMRTEWQRDIAKLRINGGINGNGTVGSAGIGVGKNGFSSGVDIGNETGEFRVGFNFGFSM